MPFFTTTPTKILPKLCKGVAPQQGVFLILLAYAREILGIIAEELKNTFYFSVFSV